MAVPVVEGFSSSIDVVASDMFIDKPSGIVSGELLVMLAGNEDNTASTTFDTLSGWTKAYEYGDDASDTKIAMYWRIATGSEPTTETIHFLTGSDFGGAWYLRISGADSTTPIHLIGTAAIDSFTASLASPSITTTVNDCLVFSHMSYDGADATFSVSGTGWPSTVPSTQKLEENTGSSVAWSGGWLTKDLATAGASNDLTWSVSSTDGIATVQFAVAPSGGAATASLAHPRRVNTMVVR